MFYFVSHSSFSCFHFLSGHPPIQCRKKKLSKFVTKTELHNWNLIVILTKIFCHTLITNCKWSKKSLPMAVTLLKFITLQNECYFKEDYSYFQFGIRAVCQKHFWRNISQMKFLTYHPEKKIGCFVDSWFDKNLRCVQFAKMSFLTTLTSFSRRVMTNNRTKSKGWAKVCER